MKKTEKNKRVMFSGFFVEAILLFILLLGSSIVVKAQEFLFRNTNLPLETRVNDLVSRLTLEEKVLQMMENAPAIDRLGILAFNWWNETLHGVARSGV